MKSLRCAALLAVALAFAAIPALGQITLPAPNLLVEAGSDNAVPPSALSTDISNKIIFAGNRELAAAGTPEAAVPLRNAGYVQPVVVVKSGAPATVERPSLRQVRIWETLLVAQHSAAAFDAWSTRQAITSGNGYERNPLMKPFANSAAIYPALQVAPAGVDFLGRRFMTSRHAFLRRTWWIPQTVSIAASLWCGARNVHVAELKR